MHHHVSTFKTHANVPQKYTIISRNLHFNTCILQHSEQK